MTNRKNRKRIPYVILGSDHDQNVRLYETYDVDFLYNKHVTLLSVATEGDAAVEQIEAKILAAGGGKLSPRFLESLRAEILFTALHQCETFFALLIALFQPLPHWLYLTTYETKEIKQAIDKIVAGNIKELSGGSITNMADFVKVAVYTEIMPSDPKLASRWNDNLENAAWLIECIGEFFQRYDRAYNSYKHGLRVMTGPHRLSIAPQNWDGTLAAPMHLLQSSDDSVTYLQVEPVWEDNGEKELPVSEVTKTFNPEEASFYMAKMQQMLTTIQATRLAHLKGDSVGPSINTFFKLDRDAILQLRAIDEWKHGPVRSDEAQAYERYVTQMRANAAVAHADQPADADPSTTPDTEVVHTDDIDEDALPEPTEE